MKRGRREYWLIFTAIMIWESHGLSMEEKYSACRTTCECRFYGEQLVVKCRGNKLLKVPREIPENTTELDLSDNYITDLEAGTFKKFTHLRYLLLQNNSIRRLPDGVFDNLRHLERLYLKENLLDELPSFRESVPSLTYLFLSANKIRDIQKTHVTRIPNVQHLYLDYNELKEVPSTLKQLTKLKYLNLNFNNISVIEKDAFKPLKHLVELKLCCNTIVEIQESAFPVHLIILNLLRNKISSVPTEALKSLHRLQHLVLEGNPITRIDDYAFDGLHDLYEVELSWKKIEEVEHNAFFNLSNIYYLSLVNVKLSRFPNLTGTTSLQSLTLASNTITALPEDFCQMFPHLLKFDADMNWITRIPDMSRCSSMKILKLDHNKISTVGSSLQRMKNIQDITLDGNKIREISGNVFKEVTSLETLKMADNGIVSIDDMAFISLKKLEKLSLNGNKIREISGNVFKEVTRLQTLKMANNNIVSIADTAFISLENLEKLDLRNNSFPNLPKQGLQNVIELDVRVNIKLKEISPESLPNVRVVKASYPYHCCEFRKKYYITNAMDSIWNWTDYGMVKSYLRMDRPENSSFPEGEEGGSGFGSGSLFDFDSEGSGSEDFENFTNDTAETLEPQNHVVNCTPLPDPFFPCDDLMGSWLRVGVWFVFLLALLGNASVVTVILLSNTKVDVSRFLIMNLAMADLCMGVYLGLLAFVDATTIGNFMHHGVEWQQSTGCKTAGFLAVLSSEASVFTLAVITIERFIAIRHALHVHRKMSLRKTAVVMALGWIMVIVIATLPLYEVSDYAKFSVCLPFETGDVKSLVFVTLILSLNLIAFVIIFACYVGIYHEIRGSNAWNTNDTQVAMRMALLVVTDFACWAPIVTIAFPAAFGMSFVSLEQAKVFTIFVFPLNSCANPFLYAIFTYQFKKDCVNIFRRVKNSPVPKIQITLTKKRFSMSGDTREQRRGSQGSAIYSPETNSDGKLTLKVPGIRFNRRYSLPAAFKLSSLQKDKKNSRGSSLNDNSRCSNENATEQSSLMQDKPRPIIDRRTAV